MDTEFLPGDFIVTHGNDIFDKGIQLFTSSPWNHAAIIIDNDGTIAELTSKGIEQNNISKYDAKERFVVHMDFSDEDRGEVLTYAKYMLAKHDAYGFLTIISIGFKILTKSRLVVKLDGTLICSEFVARALSEGGLIWPKDPSLITPADLYNFFKGKQSSMNSRSRSCIHMEANQMVGTINSSI